MKAFIFLLLLAPFSLFAQQEWPIVGARWIENYGGQYEIPYGYWIMECVGETVIDNIEFRVLKDSVSNNNPFTYFIHQDEEQFYYLFQDTLRLMYDFGVAVGDTVAFELLDGNIETGTVETIPFLVDSVSQLLIDGLSLKKIVCKNISTDLNIAAPEFYEYIERIGSTRLFLENNLYTEFILGAFPPTLRCYIDDEIEYHRPIYNGLGLDNCFINMPPNSIAETVPNEVYLQLSPNPVSEKLVVSYQIFNLRNVDSHTFIISNSLGENLLKWSVNSMDDKIIIPTQNYGNGLYFLQFIENGKVLKTERFVIQK